MSSPDFPRGVAALPERFQPHFVAHGVHALPEAVVLIGHQLAIARQLLQRLALELRRIAFDVVEDSRLEYEERAVDPGLSGQRLLIEARHAAAIELQSPEARRRAHGGDRREASMVVMEGEQLAQVDVRDAV